MKKLELGKGFSIILSISLCDKHCSQKSNDKAGIFAA